MSIYCGRGRRWSLRSAQGKLRTVVGRWQIEQQIPFDSAQGKPHRAFGPVRNDSLPRNRMGQPRLGSVLAEKARAVRRCGRNPLDSRL